MRITVPIGILAASMAGAALACPPPPPGWVPPTQEQRLRVALSSQTDIVYGQIVRSNAPGKPALLKVFHVYRGSMRKGEVISAAVGYGLPEPVWAGMTGLPSSKPVGAYGWLRSMRRSQSSTSLLRRTST